MKARRTSVVFEWVVEHIDKHGDIVDSDVGKTLDDALRSASLRHPEAVELHVGLVRELWNVYAEVLHDRTWAYVEDGVLPERFEDGQKTPQSSRDAVARHAQLIATLTRRT
jgi:hypothetical protein